MGFRLLLSIIITLSVAATAVGQTLRDSVLINFRQSKTDLDTSYMDNRKAFDRMRRTIADFNRPDSDFVLLNVKFVGGASPEGNARFNEWLSKERADRIYNYMRQGMTLPDSVTTLTLLGADWDGLLSMVAQDPNVPSREKVMDIVSDIIEKQKNGDKKTATDVARLRSLDHGSPYRYLYWNMFPSLRMSKVVLTFGEPSLPRPVFQEMTLTIDALAYPPMSPLMAVSLPEEKRPFYMALKTNMLYDLLAIPEASVEFYLGKNMSIVGNWMYGWWKNDHTHRYWRMYGGDLAFRWWFGKAAHAKPLTGHHLGVYAGLLTYDFEWGGKGYMGGLPGHSLWDRCNHHFGVEYGYSLPIARRLNIDFTLGVGYLGGQYREYVPKDNCYVWQATKYRHWFGPTKLEVSLVWLLGHGNFNIKKGGRK